MNSIELFFIEEDSEGQREDLLTIRRSIRDSSDPMNLEDPYFIKLFRLSKTSFIQLLAEVKVHAALASNSRAVPIHLKLFAVLRFFAEGNYQTGLGNDYNLGISQPTFSIILKELLMIFQQHICPKWITSEMTGQEKEEAKLSFYTKTGFPGVIGCVDGTHVRIISPKKDIQHLYYNRKGFHSINVMLVCDHKLKIRFVDARHPGSCHDSFVWNNSELRTFLQQKYIDGERNTWLLGDSGYPLENFLITLFRSVVERSLEATFNSIHSRTRNHVERSIDVLKNRWRCILGARELHYTPEKATQIINACCAIHNIAISFNKPYDSEVIVDSENPYETHELPHINHNETANSIRNSIMNSIINSLL